MPSERVSVAVEALQLANRRSVWSAGQCQRIDRNVAMVGTCARVKIDRLLASDEIQSWIGPMPVDMARFCNQS